MEMVSLDHLRDNEHRVMDYEHDDAHGLAFGTTTDRFMELNDGRMGEDSEELTMRENRQSKLLQKGHYQSYQPHG